MAIKLQGTDCCTRMKMSSGRLLPSEMIVVAVLVGYLAVQSHCGRRPQLGEARNGTGSRHDAAAAVNSTAASASASAADDESKLYLVFCVRRLCEPRADYDYYDQPMPINCFCCVSKKGPPCYETEKECRANCPACNPTCAPPQPAGDDASVHA
ncbi:hypothetical protein GUJ93_ZPchr0013g37169 [Zizania palustris]|uniref:Uncharacterized protein n=1 Tax=Zizania palustris TaxID=103762 RepID=A0A8J5WZN1_ZIZPA|nr:hypothetical protein GUJ93_ZPchr0013g37169 [Zizania palustris]